MYDWMDKLERAKALLDAGALSKDEFEAEKARLLPQGPIDPDTTDVHPSQERLEIEGFPTGTWLKVGSALSITLLCAALLFSVFPSQERSESLQQKREHEQYKMADGGQKPTLNGGGATRIPDEPENDNKIFEPREKLESTNVTPEFLLGRWSWDESCATSLAIEFKSNGKYEDVVSTGRFTLMGNKVSFTEARFFDGEWVDEMAHSEMGKSLNELKDSGHLDDSLVEIVRIDKKVVRMNGVELFKCGNR